MRVNGKEINQMRAAERCPEKAGVGGSSPSLATTFSRSYSHSKIQFHCVSFQNLGPPGCAYGMSRVIEGESVVRPCNSSGKAGDIVSAFLP